VSPREFEPSRPFGASPGFLSRDIGALVANEPWQVDGYFRLRREIFEREQRLFTDSDVDEHDAHATPIVALSHVAGMPFEVIGVAHEYRRVGAVGGALIRTAVTTAHAHGCRRFLATVQARNVRYFEHYDFHSLGELSVRDQPHHLMQAELRSFPPCPRALAALAAAVARAA
jgi:predicted GNAT family N-acyltransferase